MRILRTAVLAMLVAASLWAQPATDLSRAQQALAAAEAAGAAAFAKTLYDDAVYRARFAQENWNSNETDGARTGAHARDRGDRRGAGCSGEGALAQHECRDPWPAERHQQVRRNLERDPAPRGAFDDRDPSRHDDEGAHRHGTVRGRSGQSRRVHWKRCRTTTSGSPSSTSTAPNASRAAHRRAMRGTILPIARR